MQLGPTPTIDLKQCVQDAKDRVEQARTERLKAEEEARQLREAMAKDKIRKAVEPYVRDIARHIEANSKAGFSKFNYKFSQDINSCFEGPHYNFKVVEGSTADWLLRHLKESGLSCRLHARHDRDYDSWDIIYTTTYMMEVSF
jgi:hypothetical protein